MESHPWEQQEHWKESQKEDNCVKSKANDKCRDNVRESRVAGSCDEDSEKCQSVEEKEADSKQVVNREKANSAGWCEKRIAGVRCCHVRNKRRPRKNASFSRSLVRQDNRGAVHQQFSGTGHDHRCLKSDHDHRVGPLRLSVGDHAVEGLFP